MNFKVIIRRKYRGLHLSIITIVSIIGYLGCILSSVGLFGHLEEQMPIEVLDHYSFRKLLNTTTTTSSSGLYPPELFSAEEIRHGAILLYIIGMIYMFVALAIVCDEFFVPTLEVITKRLNISEDVAGATFMAAGGSAPELFTSVIGVFLAKNNVGIGTIVGSAVFNILFVIGMCAVVSKGVLQLTWWPLFRDVTFYSIDLAILIGFFQDSVIYWWEALILFLCYFIYVIFMKFNHKIEAWVKNKLRKRATQVGSTDHLVEPKPERCHSIPILHSGGSRFRHGIVDLIIHHIDPHHHKSKPHEKAMHLHAIATLKVVLGTTHTEDEKVDRDNNTLQTISNGHISNSSKTENTFLTLDNIQGLENGFAYNQTNGRNDAAHNEVRTENGTGNSNADRTVVTVTDTTQETNEEEDKEEGLKEDEEPLDISWPEGWRSRILYVILAPIVFSLWLSLPDVRKPEKQKWYLVSFFGSILWIGIFSYLMVWWANTAGDAIGIKSSIMGLTILAAGTSIPDLITSVIVARKGFGDMAVSSSVGSNLFDITVGLPFPWLLYVAINSTTHVTVNSSGLVCSIILLFVMLIAVIIIIAICKWKMSKVLGITMLLLYVVFEVLAVLLEVDIIECFVK